MDHNMPGHDMPGHGGHDMPMPMKCTMNMLWNTQIDGTCIVFEQWHISTKASFVLSCFAVIALAILYEYLRTFQKSVDVRIALVLSSQDKGGRSRSHSRNRSSSRQAEEASGLLSGLVKSAATGVPVPLGPRLLRATVYGATVFLSFFLMLVFMTYNAYLILSVVLGAAIGHFIFGSTMNPDAVLSDGNGKGMACH